MQSDSALRAKNFYSKEKMRTVDIRKKLEELGCSVADLSLGEYDYIGRFTAERTRDANHHLFKTVGMFYRANYERGILISQLIRKYRISTMLEIGFGRGYSTFCAAKTLCELGLEGKIVTVDPSLDENHLKMLQQVFPREWFDKIEFRRGKSNEVLPFINDKFDLVYIDGDHSFEATKYDWEMTKDKWNKCLLFDDYHMPENNDPGIQCRELIDTIEHPSKELILMDRRIFFDDRRVPDDKINYGQVLLTNPELQKGDSW